MSNSSIDVSLQQKPRTFKIHPKKPRKTATILEEIRHKLERPANDPLAVSDLKGRLESREGKTSQIALQSKAFSVKRIEKYFSKIDNAVGEKKLDMIFDDQDQEKSKKKAFSRLCSTYFKLGKCLDGEACNCAHDLAELEKTYIPLGPFCSRRMDEVFPNSDEPHQELEPRHPLPQARGRAGRAHRQDHKHQRPDPAVASLRGGQRRMYEPLTQSRALSCSVAQTRPCATGKASMR